ncbi:MAG: hypothetical protein KDJ29_17695, partial [Hyphomicrobiales bacterium]|nr:hypothetical protein [Hyphomicrobiales bacterium]
MIGFQIADAMSPAGKLSFAYRDIHVSAKIAPGNRLPVWSFPEGAQPGSAHFSKAPLSARWKSFCGTDMQTGNFLLKVFSHSDASPELLRAKYSVLS